MYPGFTFFSEIAAMNWTSSLTELQEMLSDLFPTNADVIRVAREAGLNIRLIEQSSRVINTWHSVLVEAAHQSRIESIVDIAGKDYPGCLAYAGLIDVNFRPTSAPKIGEPIQWQTEVPEDALEKILGTISTLMPVGFLETGILRSRAVARVVREDQGMGSGFLIEPNLLVTCNHVLPDAQRAAGAIAQFNYQKAWDGTDAPAEEYRLMPEAFFLTSKTDDWTVVQVGAEAPARWGTLPMTQRQVKPKERVFIVQHPGGGPKQIGLGENLVVYAGQGRIQYLTDTMPGSSGSPVFSEHWEVVGVHHSGGWITEPGTGRKFYRNEGIASNCILSILKNCNIKY
jgi:V8-like Glu-specific endopeptidase